MTVEVGNHDMPYFNLVERFTDPYRRFRAIEGAGRARDRPAGRRDRPAQDHGARAVALSTGRTAGSPSRRWRETLAAIDALPPGTRVLVTAHHPLTERRPERQALTINGTKALAELAARKVLAVLTGHVHDAFDIVQRHGQGPCG